MKKENYRNIIRMAVVAMLVLFAGVPLILEHLIFRNNVYSVLSNGEWGSFLGSYIGGIVSGAGTLIAMYVTTKATRKIQEENLNQIMEDRSLEEKKERKQFTDGIAHDISVYTTDIIKYFHDCRRVESLDIDKNNVDMQLQSIQSQIQREYARKQIISLEGNTATYRSIESKIEQLSGEESRMRYKLERIESEIRNIPGDRRTADERYFVLRIKLQNIEEAKSLVEQLEYIYINSSNVKGTQAEFAEEETQKLLVMTVEFTNKYVNGTAPNYV